MIEHILTILGVGGIIFLFYLFVKPDKAPSATGVSSRREKKSVRITFLHCWLFSDYPLKPFRYCPDQDSYLLLTQAMQPLVQRLPVGHYRDALEEQGLHPAIEPKHSKGQTDWRLIITYGAILYTSHQLQVTHDQARYWLLCHFYGAATKQHLIPVVIKEEPEEIVEERQALPESVLAPVYQEETIEEFHAQQTKLLSFPLDVIEEEEDPEIAPIMTDQTLTELLSAQEKAKFTTLLGTKLTKIYQFHQMVGKITQDQLVNIQKILKHSEWRFLLNGEEGILWSLGIVGRNELGETVITQSIDTAFTLVEAWIEAQQWGR